MSRAQLIAHYESKGDVGQFLKNLDPGEDSSDTRYLLVRYTAPSGTSFLTVLR